MQKTTIAALLLGLAGCGANTSQATSTTKDEYVKAIAANAAEGFKTFREEADRVTALINCPRPKITPPEYGMGSLYGCIMGRAQTAKFWINEDIDRPDAIKNIKVMWNDWFKDGGYGVHADKGEAEAMVASLTRLYAPTLKAEVLNAFRGEQETRFEYGAYRIEYRFTRGPMINERLLIVTER